jgi:hypothetical protein
MPFERYSSSPIIHRLVDEETLAATELAFDFHGLQARRFVGIQATARGD